MYVSPFLFIIVIINNMLLLLMCIKYSSTRFYFIDKRSMSSNPEDCVVRCMSSNPEDCVVISMSSDPEDCVVRIGYRNELHFVIAHNST